MGGQYQYSGIVDGGADICHRGVGGVGGAGGVDRITPREV